MTQQQPVGMSSGRVEAFSDGVMAIVITIMVLEFKTPHESSIAALKPLVPVMLSYVLSFIYVGIYWNNHHHLFQAAERVDGWTLWANLHLLFWLSLIPFTTSWMGETSFAAWPTAAYGIVLLGSAAAYSLLSRVLIKVHGPDSLLGKAVGDDFKGRLSVALYAVGVVTSFWLPKLACAAYVCVAMMWIRPDRRIERRIERERQAAGEVNTENASA